MMAAPSMPAGPTLGELIGDLVELPPAVAMLSVSGMSLDSRRLSPGDLFLACEGSRQHGLEFAAGAVAAGASAIVAEPSRDWPESRIRALGQELKVPVVGLSGLSMWSGELAARFHGRPGARLRVFGITGTNGKTSCAHFLAQALAGRERCALIGTLGNGFADALNKASHTTPDAISLHRMFDEFVSAGATAVAMEVSSHALHQYRVGGVDFEVAVFTNLSRDHLDYHGTMESYAEAKARLFAVPSLRAAVINADDAFGRRLLATLPSDVKAIAYGIGEMEHASFERWLRAASVRVTTHGLEMEIEGNWGRGRLNAGVLGRFNGHNLLAVLGTLLALDIPFEEAVHRLSGVQGVPGRMELFSAAGRPTAVVDYAHTPDALEQGLQAVRAHCPGRLWCVFGCGGDRDRGKRPLMGAVAERLADAVMLTNDNPRSEEPRTIIDDIMAGLQRPAAALVEPDRGIAIERALREAAADDWVLIAGKGHEDYQIIGDRMLPFSDREQVRRCLAGGES